MELFRGAAFFIDLRWRALGASSSALWEKDTRLHARKDPTVRRDLVLGDKKTSRKRKATGPPDVQVYERVIEQHRYFLSACQAMDGAPQVALVCDGSGISRQERLCGALMNLDTGACCWLPPQDAAVSRWGRHKSWVVNAY